MTTTAQRIVALAQSQLGVPYVYGGASPAGFDCSGLVLWITEQLGLTGWQHGSSWQFYNSPAPRVQGAPQAGDFVFFDYLPGPVQPEHVGICIGGNQMIDAPYTGVDVRVDTFAFTPGVYYGATRPAALIPNPQAKVEPDMFIFEDPATKNQYLCGPPHTQHLNPTDYALLLKQGCPVWGPFTPQLTSALIAI
jgi:hypothetical protein